MDTGETRYCKSNNRSVGPCFIENHILLYMHIIINDHVATAIVLKANIVMHTF